MTSMTQSARASGAAHPPASSISALRGRRRSMRVIASGSTGEQLLVEGDVPRDGLLRREVGRARPAGDGGGRVLGELERLEHRSRQLRVVVVTAGEDAPDLGAIEDLRRRADG